MESILSRVGETIFISSIDLKHAFWQVELDEKSRPLTAFTIPGRPLYLFRRMPFDLCKLVLSFELNFIKIGRLYHIAAIGTIGKLVGK